MKSSQTSLPPLDFHQRLRRRIYEIVETAPPGDWLSQIYDKALILCIVLSIFPLCFKQSNIIFESLEDVAVGAFAIDYVLRWITADLHHEKWGRSAFIRYPFTFFAIVDLLSIAPLFIDVSRGLRLLRLLRMAKSLKTLRLLRYSTGFQVIYKAVQKEQQALLAVLFLSIGYIFLTALLMFSVEPQNFNNFFDAIYWAVTTLTTVGYGDVYPLSELGRVVSMISSFVGVAIVALPTGIITAGFMSEMEQHYIEREARLKAFEKRLEEENAKPNEDEW